MLYFNAMYIDKHAINVALLIAYYLTYIAFMMIESVKNL